MTIWLALGGLVLLLAAVAYFFHPAAAPSLAGSPPAPQPVPPAPEPAPEPAPAPAATPGSSEAKAEPGPIVRPSRLPRLRAPEPDEDATGLTALAPMLPSTPAARPVVNSHSDGAEIDEPSGLHSLILVTAVAQTDTGRRRHRNEDSHRMLDSQAVFLVADGMGGHAAGEVASQLAAQIIGDAFTSGRFRADRGDDLPRRALELQRAIQAANETIFMRSSADAALRGMGTTVVVACFSPTKRRAYIAHVGDSRCYRVRKRQLAQLTTDHTLAVATGVPGALGERLTRALGIEREVQVDIQLDAPEPGDVYVLCSDGLSKMIPDEEIRDLVLAHHDLEQASRALVDAANERGGRDNITVVLIRVDPFSLVRGAWGAAGVRAPDRSRYRDGLTGRAPWGHNRARTRAARDRGHPRGASRCTDWRAAVARRGTARRRAGWPAGAPRRCRLRGEAASVREVESRRER